MNALKFKVSAFLLMLIMTLMLIASCKKEDPVTTDEENISGDNALSEKTYDDAVIISDQGINGNLESFKNADGSGILGAGCATITSDSTSSPYKLVIDFGPANCMCLDGKMRRGKINVEWTGNYFTAGSYRTITFDNYFVNDHQVTGTSTVTTNAKNAAGKWNFSISSNGSIIKPNNGGTINYTSNRNREWTEGDNTLFNWLDDVWTITGTANGTSALGIDFTASIINGLRKEIGCKHFVSGILELTAIGNTNNYTWSLDYGTGVCDNKAILNKPNNTSVTITLP